MFVDKVIFGILSLSILFIYFAAAGLLSKGIFNLLYHFSPSVRVWVDAFDSEE